MFVCIRLTKMCVSKAPQHPVSVCVQWDMARGQPEQGWVYRIGDRGWGAAEAGLGGQRRGLGAGGYGQEWLGAGTGSGDDAEVAGRGSQGRCKSTQSKRNRGNSGECMHGAR